MKYNICSACYYFKPQMCDEKRRYPKHCSNPIMSRYFGLDEKGFPLGIDIIHCDAFTQWPIDYGDVKITGQSNTGVSYVLTQPRNFKLTRVPELFDNSQNIKEFKL